MPNNQKPRVSGAIFQNTSGRGPEFTGVIEIDGVKTQIAMWPKTSAAGKPYLQISEDRQRPKGAPPGTPRQAGPVPQRQPVAPAPRAVSNPDMDDDIPF